MSDLDCALSIDCDSSTKEVAFSDASVLGFLDVEAGPLFHSPIQRLASSCRAHKRLVHRVHQDSLRGAPYGFLCRLQNKCSSCLHFATVSELGLPDFRVGTVSSRQFRACYALIQCELSALFVACVGKFLLRDSDQFMGARQFQSCNAYGKP